VILVDGTTEWLGWVFVDSDGVLGFFLEGDHLREVDLRKGYRAKRSSANGRLVAVQDLASDCLGCSRLIIHLNSALEETCTSLEGESDLVSLLRIFVPLGFQLLHPSSHPYITGTLIGLTI
jgi:hypothetical protein